MVARPAVLPTLPHKSKDRLLWMLRSQVQLGRFNAPLTDAVAEALGPQRIPLDLACDVLYDSGYVNQNEAAMAHPRPYLDAVLAAESKIIEIKSVKTACRLVQTLVTMRRRGYHDAPVGDALAATAAVVGRMHLLFRDVEKVASLVVHLGRRLTRTEWRTLWDTVLMPMYRRILDGLPTASVGMAAVALTLAPSRDRGRIGQRLVAITGDSADAFHGIPVIYVLRMARNAHFLPSPIDAAHLNRHFTQWCRMQSQLTPPRVVAALRVLTLSPRMSPTALRKLFVDVRNVVMSLNSRDVLTALVAMTRCQCVDLELLRLLMVRALAIAPTWHENDIAPAIFAMAHLRVVCRPVVDALVRRLWTFEVGVKRRNAPKVVKALAALIA